jgi:hypothetical protein
MHIIAKKIVGFYMEKKRLVVSYKNLTPELLELVKQKYPHGYQNHVIKITKPNGDYFYAITLDTSEASYLIKVNVKIDSKPKDEDDERDFFGGDSDEIGTSDDSFPEESEEPFEEESSNEDFDDE